MTIKTIYKVEGDSNEYDSEQEAQIAEACKNYKSMYLTQAELKGIAEAISAKYLLVPIVATEALQEQKSTPHLNDDDGDDDVPF